MATLDLGCPVAQLTFEAGSVSVIELGFTVKKITQPLYTYGYAARCAFRENIGTAVLLSLTTANFLIVLADVDPNITLLIPATSTSLTSSFDAIVGIYDIYLDPNGVEDSDSFKILRGAWMKNSQVTP